MYLVNLMEQKVSKLADAYLQKKNIPVNFTKEKYSS